MSTPGMQNGLWLVAASWLLGQSAMAVDLGSAFSYQGRLDEAGQPATGLFDLQFCLYEQLAGGGVLQCAPDQPDVPVEDGLFAVAVDFGDAAFAGQARYLELRVRAGASSGAYTTLSPRQLLRAVPEALRSRRAELATSAAHATTADSATLAATATTATNATHASQADTATTAASADQATTALHANTADTVPAGAIGLAQIDRNEVQSRISSSCAPGEYFRGVNVDGSVLCEPVPGIPRITLVDDPANAVGRFSAMAIGADGLPVIAYRDHTAGAVKVAKCHNAACSGSSTINTVADEAADVAEYISLAIGNDGLPVISHRNVSQQSVLVTKCGNADCSSGNSTVTIDDNGNDLGYYTSIAVLPDGRPVVAYLDGTAGTLKMVRCGSARCTGASSTNVVDAGPNNVGEYVRVAIGADGFPVLAYRDGTLGALKFARCVNNECVGATVRNLVDHVAGLGLGYFVSLAIGADGIPIISHYHFSAGQLRVAKCANASCGSTAKVTVVDASPNLVGQESAIAIGVDGIPILSYRDLSRSALKVARCSDADCTEPAQISTVDDSVHGLGANSSIAIGLDGLPIISYADATSGALRVLKCGSRSCQ